MKDLFIGIPKRRVVFLVLGSLFYSVLNSAWSHVSVQVVDKKMGNDMLTFIIGMFIFAVGWRLTEFILDLHLTMTDTIIENNVGEYYFNKLYKIKPEVLKKNSTGYISGLITKVTNWQESCFENLVVALPCDIAYILYFSIVLGRYNIILGISIVLIYLGTNLLRMFMSNILVQKKADKLAGFEGARSRLYIDVVSNMNTVQKMQAKDFINLKINDAKNECIEATKKWMWPDEFCYIIVKLVMFGYLPICLSMVYLLDIKSIYTNPVLLAMLATVGTQIGHNARSLFRFFTNYSKFRGSCNKLKEIVDSCNERKCLSSEEFNTLELKDVDYSYIDKDTQDTVRIRIPYFRVNKGDKVCVYGESGQGKTTLLHIASNEIDTDNVYLNGEKSNDRLDCVFIAQDTEMLNFTLRENLLLSKDTNRDWAILEYMDDVGLRDWYDSQPDGMDTLLGERGVFVSTGQRQRLNLIRGLLMKDKEVYLLDEPTSNVDDETEEKIVELIKDDLKYKTVIIVTHRPKIMSVCNKAYKFTNGVLGECELVGGLNNE